MTADDLARLHASAFTVPPPWTADAFAGLLAGPGILLAADAEGFALARVAGGETEVLTLAVAPAARRRGLATRLLTEVLDRAAGHGARVAFLEVAEENAAARALYARAGFTEAGRRPGYYAGSDALILRKAL